MLPEFSRGVAKEGARQVDDPAGGALGRGLASGVAWARGREEGMPIAGTVLSRSREAIFGSPKPKRRVKTALIAAGGRFSTTDSFTAPKQLIRVDSGPVIHLLVRSLHRAGIERIIIATDNLYQERSS